MPARLPSYKLTLRAFGSGELNPQIFFPDSFDAFRKDRVGDVHCGVFFALMRDLLCTDTPELDTGCEIIWCKLNIIGCRTLHLGSLYRPTNRKPEIENNIMRL